MNPFPDEELSQQFDDYHAPPYNVPYGGLTSEMFDDEGYSPPPPSPPRYYGVFTSPQWMRMNLIQQGRWRYPQPTTTRSPWRLRQLRRYLRAEFRRSIMASPDRDTRTWDYHSREPRRAVSRPRVYTPVRLRYTTRR